MIFALNAMDYALKMMGFILKMMDFANKVPLVSGLTFNNITTSGHPACVSTELAMIERACNKCNTSKCYDTAFTGPPGGCKGHPPPPPPQQHLPPQTFACKRAAKTMFGEITLPWGVCLPRNAPVNLDQSYPNWGEVREFCTFK